MYLIIGRFKIVWDVVFLTIPRNVITINVPLILKVRDIIFFSRAKHIMGHFTGFFEGAKTFLTHKLSREYPSIRNTMEYGGKGGGCREEGPEQNKQ